MSGRGPVYEMSQQPFEGMNIDHNGYRYRVVEVFRRRGGTFRLRTRSNDARSLEMWFTVTVKEGV